MKCPVQLARDLSAEGGREIEHSVVRRQNATILRCRLGAGDESSRGDFASHGKEPYLVGGSRDHWDFRSQHAALEAAVPGAWLRRIRGPAEGQTQPEAGAAEGGRGGAAALRGEVCGPKRAALSREAAGGAWHRTQLHLGEAGAARGGAGEEGAEAGCASQATAAAT